MCKNTKFVNRRYFYDIKPISIEEAQTGDIVWVRVYSRQNSVRELTCYGRLLKKTKHFFDVLYYFPADIFAGSKTNSALVETIERYEAERRPIVRWAKKSILELVLSSTLDRMEEVQSKSTSALP